MISLGVSHGPVPETRQASSGYTTAIVNAIDAAAAGTGGGVAAATAAVETAAGLWARALALATVEPKNVRTEAVTAAVLAMTGRALCRSGEIVFFLEVAGGRVRLLPAAQSYVTIGSVDPATWQYVVTLYGASDTRVVYPRYDGVAHLRYMVDPHRTWQGRAPWASASLSGALLAGVERQLAGEAGGKSGYIMATPDVGDSGQEAEADGEDDPLDSLRKDLAAAGGGTVLAPAQTGGYGAGPGVAPQREYTPHRFGLDPPEGMVELRRDVGRDVLASCGIPPVLANHAAAGTSMREAWRQFTAGTVEPLAVIIAEQLSEALNERISLTLPRSSDVATLSRAVGSLTSAGMSLDDARAIVKL